MHPSIQHEIAKARVADMHRQAERDRIAQAAHRARLAKRRHGTQPTPGVGALAHRLLQVLRARYADAADS